MNFPLWSHRQLIGVTFTSGDCVSLNELRQFPFFPAMLKKKQTFKVESLRNVFSKNLSLYDYLNKYIMCYVIL